MKLRDVITACCLFLALLPAHASDVRPVPLANGNTIEVKVFPAQGSSLVLWLPSEHGLTDGLIDLANSLVENGIETWLADPFSTWFLPVAYSSLAEVPREEYAQLIAAAMATQKKVYLATSDRGTSLMLEAARLWQAGAGQALAGGIVISPNLYIETPVSGQEAEYTAIAHATNLPLFLFVAKMSTMYLRAGALQEVLQAGGSDVFVQLLPDVRDRFFFRPDATGNELETTTRLPGLIGGAMKLLDTLPRDRVFRAAELSASEMDPGSGKTGRLLEFEGGWEAPLFRLPDLQGRSHDLSSYKGRVVLVNFWASWCPPCIHEIPSMSKLQASLQDRPFRILAINLGEHKQDIEAFLAEHPVNFTVLLDPDQAHPEKWKVFAFPTSYLVDRKGRIRYSAAGGLDWNTREVKQLINALVAED